MRFTASRLLPLSLMACVSLAAQAPQEGHRSTSEAIERVLDAKLLPANRVQLLWVLGRRAAEAPPGDRAVIRDAVTHVMGSSLTEVRAAAAAALGSTGPEAVPALAHALSDYHYQVRVAAATSLGRLGRPSLSAAAALAGALDPYLGAAPEASATLIAIGPDALPILEARLKAAPPADHVRPVLTAVMASLHNRRDLVTEFLENKFAHGPNGKGFVLIEPLRTNASGTPYEPGKHRIRARFSVLHYGSPQRIPPETRETTVVAWQAVNSGLYALAGRRAGDRVRLLLSPDIAESLVLGTAKYQLASRSHVNGTTGYFDVTIDRVCEPQIWTILRVSGIFGSIKVETSCKD
jgi:hypothetical protein